MKAPIDENELYKAIASMSPAEREDMMKFVQMFMAMSPGGKGMESKDGRQAKKKSSSGGAHYTQMDYPHFRKDEPARKYTLRVTLKHITPSIYRKFEVPSNITLRHLADLVLELMVWSGGHLNAFHIKGHDYAPAYQRENEDNFFLPFDEERNHNQEDFILSEVLSEKGKAIELEYDFGDGWLHEVKLSSVADYEAGEPQIVRFIKGERACPPEDCGGIWGYEELLDIRDRWMRYTMSMGRKPSRDDLDRLRWYGMERDYDPEEFDIEEAEEICNRFTECPR